MRVLWAGQGDDRCSWWSLSGRSAALESREMLDQRRDDQRAGEMQNQRASGAFLCCKVDAGRLLGNAVEKGKPCPLKCARESCCACPRLAVPSSSLSVQKVLLFLGFFFPKISFSQNAINGKGRTKIIGLWHQKSSLKKPCKTAADSSGETRELSIRYEEPG